MGTADGKIGSEEYEVAWIGWRIGYIASPISSNDVAIQKICLEGFLAYIPSNCGRCRGVWRRLSSCMGFACSGIVWCAGSGCGVCFGRGWHGVAWPGLGSWASGDGCLSGGLPVLVLLGFLGGCIMDVWGMLLLCASGGGVGMLD